MLFISLLPMLPKSQISPHKVQAARHSIQGMISNKSKESKKMCQKLEQCWAPNMFREQRDKMRVLSMSQMTCV